MAKADFEQSLHQWEEWATALQIGAPSLTTAPGADLAEKATHVAGELGVKTSGEQILLAAARALARDVVHGRIERPLAAARFSRLRVDKENHVWLSRLPTDQVARETLFLAQRILGMVARMQLSEP